MATENEKAQVFLERDFLAYEKHRQDDPDLNALRLSIRRKLKAITDEAKKQAKALGYETDSAAGLHHPYSFNNFRVSEQRAYLCRSNKERKKLKSFLELLQQEFGTLIHWYMPQMRSIC